MAVDPTWDFQDPASKDRLLAVLRDETDATFELLSVEEHWHSPTPCPGWEVRDMVGHLIDATDSYLTAFAIARAGRPRPEPVGVAGMAKASDEAARSYRGQPRDQLLARLGTTSDQLLNEFEALSDSDWSSLLLPDRYLGPLPASIIATGMLGGSTVHGWDVRQALGLPLSISSDAADLLVPFIFLLWSATADTSSVPEPYPMGIRTTGHNGGDTRIDVFRAGLRYTSGPIEDCPTILEFDPGTLVLAAYGRLNGGTIHGDKQQAANFRSLFTSI